MLYARLFLLMGFSWLSDCLHAEVHENHRQKFNLFVEVKIMYCVVHKCLYDNNKKIVYPIHILLAVVSSVVWDILARHINLSFPTLP
jgi:hypothetical protein